MGFSIKNVGIEGGKVGVHLKDVPKNADINIDGLYGKNVKELIKANFAPADPALDVFVRQASEHFHELSGEQRDQFQRVIADLKANDPESKVPAAIWLLQLAGNLGTSVLANLIYDFVGLPRPQ